MVGGRLTGGNPFPVLLAAAVLFAACAPLPKEPGPAPDPPGVAAEPIALEGVDEAVAEALPGLVPRREEWPPPEEVRPAPEGSRILTRSVPLSSLAYFPRLLPGLVRSLAEAGYEGFRVDRYPVPDGETWEIEVPVGEGLSYRLNLTSRIAGRAAIIVDDCGNSLRNRDLLFSIDYPLTLAVLPGLRHTAAVDRLAAEHGFEVILHCPMEGLNSDLDPGPGVLTREMEAGEVSRRFAENIRELPHAVGVNNHMGSAFTADTGAMEMLMGEIKARELFFVDSLTVPNTATGGAAAAAGVSFLSRDVFLDHENREEFILGQLEALKRKALRRGSAIAIGHDRTLTLGILARELPSLADEHLQLVPVSDLIETAGRD